MPGKLLRTAILLFAAHSAFAKDTDRLELKDPYFGEALFYAYQGEHFDAISRLDTELKQYYGVDEPQLDSLHLHINQAEFSVGDFELSYRMHRRAGRAIEAVIEGNVAPEVRNEAIFRLARIYFQKEQNVNALHMIERIEGEVPTNLVNDVAFLKGQIYMVNGKFAEAEEIFRSLENAKSHEGFAIYNLGVSQLAQEKEKEGILSLAKTGEISSNDRAVLAIKDKANLTLGSRLLEKGELQAAQQYLERVRLDGPFSNRALLGLGWAAVKNENYERALVPWSILTKRGVTDQSVQEAMLGVPYSYGKLGLYGKSALLYGRALDAIGKELDKLNASIKSIKEGKFLKALVREEIKQDRNWVLKLRELEETPETYYLMSLMASHDFQSSLQNYLDLEQLRKRLESWQEYYKAYEGIIALRRQYYEPLLPGIDDKFRKLDSVIRLRLEQRDKLDSRLKSMLVSPRPDFLATADERVARVNIAKLEKRIGKKQLHANPNVAHRIDRLKGYIQWNIHTQYDERLTQAFQNLYALDTDITRLKEIYGSFVRTRQAATQSYQGYDEPIRRLRIKTRNALGKVETLMARQGHMLEVMAVSQLEKRRQRLEESQVKARFAMAESYDRATMSQAPKAEAQAQDKNGTEPANETQAGEAKAEETGTKEQSVTTPSADNSAEENQNKGQDEK